MNGSLATLVTKKHDLNYFFSKISQIVPVSVCLNPPANDNSGSLN